MNISNITTKKLEINNIDISDIELQRISEIFMQIHNKNFHNQIGKQYFSDIFSNEQYDTYILTIKNNKNNIKEFDNIIGYTIFYDVIYGIDLFEIVIDKNYQSKGLGSKLLKESLKFIFLEEKYKYRHIEDKKILLEVNEYNKEAITLYKKNGFKQIAIRKNYYGENKHGLIMEKTGVSENE